MSLTVEHLRNRTSLPTVQGLKQIIPTDIFKLIGRCHSTYVGHWGVLRTMEKVRKTQMNDPKCPVKSSNNISSRNGNKKNFSSRN